MEERIFPEGMGFIEALNRIIRVKHKNFKKPDVKEKDHKKSTPLRKNIPGGVILVSLKHIYKRPVFIPGRFFSWKWKMI